MGFICLLLATAVIIEAANAFTIPEDVFQPKKTSVDINELERHLNGGKQHICSLNPSNVSLRNGIPNINHRWRHGIFFHPSPAWNSTQMTLINEALTELNRHLCVGVWIWPQDSHPTGDYVEIKKGPEGSGCWADLGRIGGKQTMNLEENGCLFKFIIIHEAFHSLGIHHEQCRIDRDEHVDVFWDNIQCDRAFNFQITPGFLTFNLSYDYWSIMHYDSKAFVLDDNDPEMFSILKKDGSQIGQNLNLTVLDIAKLRAMYNCD